MKTMIGNKYSIVFVILFMMTELTAQRRTQLFVGARPSGLGETFVSVADDGNAVYWNPAGLPALKRIEFHSMYTNLYNITGLQNTFLSFVYPLTNRYGLGFCYFNLGFDDDILEYYRNKIYVSLGACLLHDFYLGGSFKYISTDARLDGISEGKASGFGFDFGAFCLLKFPRIRFLKQINFGAMTYDIGGSSITYSESRKSENILPQSIRLGMTFYPSDDISLKYFSLRNSLVSFDIDDRYHLGIETWMNDQFGLRAGLQKDLHTKEDMIWSVGGSVKIPYVSMQLDYAYEIQPVLPASHIFSVSLIPSLSPVKITDIIVDDLYASFYQTYANNKIGYATIRNDYHKPLKLTMRVSIPELNEEEVTETFMMNPDDEKKYDFSILLSKDALNIMQYEYKQLKIRVDYTIKNETKHTEATKKICIYGRGAVTWEHPGKAVAFVTKLDKMVELFANNATESFTCLPGQDLCGIYTAAALFNAMSAAGIRYSEDPSNPFSVIPKNQYSIDYIQYPAETIIRKRGDCDDLTVLYASLLEYSGLNTALISTVDHITLLLNTNIHEQNWVAFPMGDSLFVTRNHTYWIPVEVTEIGNAFSKAWQTGYKNYQTWKNDEDFQVVDVSNVEGIYLSSSPDEYKNKFPDPPDRLKMRFLMSADSSWIENRKAALPIWHLKASLIRNPLNFDQENKLGIIYAHLDSMTQAADCFTDIINQDANYMNARVNIGNVQCITGHFSEAEKTYLQVLDKNKTEPGIHLNLSILYQLWKYQDVTDSTRLQALSEKYLLQTFELLNGNEDFVLDLLGISSSDIIPGEKADLKSWIKTKAQEVKKFIKENAKKYLFNKSVKGARLRRQGVKRGIDNERRYILWWAVHA